MDTIRHRNPRRQGLIGLGAAIHWFSAEGYMVNIPLNDSQPYDLVVDDGARLHRVQVKTTTRRSPYGVFVVQLETAGGNQSFHTRKPFDPAASDLLWVLTDEGDVYLFESPAIKARRGLSLGGLVRANHRGRIVVGEGFEPSKAEPADLQSAPFGHSGIPPG